jgi:hypothetical protein
MAKTNPLEKSLRDKAKSRKAAAAEVVAKKSAPAVSREGRVLIAGHFERYVLTALKHIAADDGATMQNIVGEALNDFLIKRGSEARIMVVENNKEGAAA